MADFLASSSNRLANSADQGGVICLDEYSVVQAGTMIDAAAQKHRVLFQHAQSGRGLAGVGNLRFGSFDGARKLPRRGRDSRQMTQQVERDSLAGEQHIRKAAGARDNFSRFDFLAVAGEGFDLLLRIERYENFFRGLEPSHNHFLAGDEAAARAHVAHQRRLRGYVAASEVFAKKETNARIQRPFVEPVHDSASRFWSSALFCRSISAIRDFSPSTFSAGARATKSALPSCVSSFTPSFSSFSFSRVSR